MMTLSAGAVLIFHRDSSGGPGYMGLVNTCSVPHTNTWQLLPCPSHASTLVDNKHDLMPHIYGVAVGNEDLCMLACQNSVKEIYFYFKMYFFKTNLLSSQ